MEQQVGVFDISELRREILTYCTGATLHPIRATSRGFLATIDEINMVESCRTCHHIVAIKRGCIACIRRAVVESGVNLGNIVCGLCEHGYYGLATLIVPRLQFATPGNARQFYNSMYTLLVPINENESAIKLRSIFARRRRKMELDPNYVWMYSGEQLFAAITARELMADAIPIWIGRNHGVATMDQTALAEMITAQIDSILLRPNDVFVNIVCALFGRGLVAAAMRVLDAVAPFYCVEYGVDLITAAIAAPGAGVDVYLSVCEFLRDYRLTQERFHRYMTAAIVAAKYEVCVELNKIAVVCGLRHYLTYTQSFEITTREQVRCANVYERSQTCANVLNGVITATEYTAQCPLTSIALVAGLSTTSTNQYRRATFLSVIWASSLDQLSYVLKYKFYYILNITPASVVNLLNAYNGLAIRAISIDLYALYLDYGPHIHPEYYRTLYTHANCIVSRVLLGMLSGNVPTITDAEIDEIWISRYDLLLAAAIRLRCRWWLERLYQHNESAWERIRDEQVQRAATVFYTPDAVASGKRARAATGRKNKTYKRRRV